MRSQFLTVIMCCIVLHAPAQSYDWWINTVHWDGVTPWERYIIFSPGFLGPNALPVPHVTNGTIDSVNAIGVSGNAYFSKGDHTQNISFCANYCFVRNKISFDASWVPVEYFNMSHQIKEQRHVFPSHYYDHHARGDVHLNINIQLFSSKSKNIQSALRIGFRFPTGEIGAARFTDAPGYYLDLSVAKRLRALPSLKFIAMAGGYFWQADNVTNRHRQNDAFLFGGGLEWNKRNLKIQTCFAGYLGYLKKEKDKPILFRTELDKTIKRTILFLQFQQGLHDFKYSSLQVGVKYVFAK